MVHAPGRDADVGRAVADFAAQVHADRELVVLSRLDRDAARVLERDCRRAAAGRGLAGSSVRAINAAAATSDAALYNLGLDAASGDLACAWPGRDRNHPDRLAVQCRHVAPDAAGAAFTERLLHARTARSLYWVDHRAGPAGGAGGMIADTLLHWRTALRLDASRADPHGAFLQDAGRRGRLVPVVGRGALTIRAEAASPAALARALPAAELRGRLDVLRAALDAYPGLLPLAVRGREGTIVHAHEPDE